MFIVRYVETKESVVYFIYKENAKIFAALFNRNSPNKLEVVDEKEKKV